MEPISAAIAGGVQLGNAIFQGNQNKKNRKHQSEENQKNRDFNSEMWEKNNAYNDPSKQMERLKNAGISPHLAYQNGAPMNSSNAPASSSASGAARGEAPRIDPTSILQAAMMKAQIENINADTQQKNANTEGQILVNGKTEIQLQNEAENIALNQSLTRTQIKVGEKTIEVDDQQISESIQRVTNLISTNDKLKQEITNLQTTNRLNEQQIVQVIASLGVMRAQINQYTAQTNLTNEQSRTEGVKRSNIASQTMMNTENYKALTRENQIGDKFDYNQAENQTKISSEQSRYLRQQVINSAKDGVLKDVNINQSELNLMLDQITTPATILDRYKGAINPFNKSSSTTTQYDANGEYKGSTVRRSKGR